MDSATYSTPFDTAAADPEENDTIESSNTSYQGL